MILSGKLVNLYFSDRNGEESIVDVALKGDDAVSEAIDKDLKTRRPGFVSHYKRFWIDQKERLWVDYGSHSEFYIGDIVDETCEECKI